jgi:hypothetical protein
MSPQKARSVIFIFENTETLKVEEAAVLMHKNPAFVRKGLQDKRFGFGYAVYNNGRWNYYINRKKFFEETGITEKAV